LKESLGIHKALQILGDAYLIQGHEDTAVCLFTVALDGFTQMDVHCGRADCMLRLGDISREHGNFPKAVEHWQAARPLFERASQAKRVADIEERLAGVNQDMLDQHRSSFTHLAEWDLSSGISEDLEGINLGKIVAL
jgi:lipopolysaccharide biosynthesis regulator YciM